MSWTAEEAKSKIANRLGEVFGNDLVIKEWESQAENKDWIKFGDIYSPRLDIAIGPLNIHSGEQAKIEKGNIEEAFTEYQPFFSNLLGRNNFNENKNPRCLLAIEIENSNKGKYMLGNFVNVSILGKIGLVVVNKNNKKVWEDAKRVEEFLEGALDRKKIMGIAKDTMLFEYSQFIDGLEKAMKKQGAYKHAV